VEPERLPEIGGWTGREGGKAIKGEKRRIRDQLHFRKTANAA